jgi:putative hemolysin
MTQSTATSPFQLDGLLPKTGQPWIDTFVAATAGQVLGLNDLDTLYHRIGPTRTPDEFIAKACAVLGIELSVPDGELAHLPAGGPVVVVANHPFGGIEGLLLAGLLRRVRPDVRVLTNYLLRRIPELAELFIDVDPFNGPQPRNVTGLRQALRWLRQGGLLLVFPAGEVSHWDFDRRTVTDPPWKSVVAWLIQSTRADAVPVYLHGANSAAFHLAGLLHPRLRTALLAKEVLNKVNTTVHVRIGAPVPHAEVKEMAVDSLTQLLRLRTYLLGAGDETPDSPGPAAAAAAMTPAPSESHADEVAALPPSSRLGTSGEQSVYVATAGQIPGLLQEIGRQRELAFRAVGEGTGRAVDLDEFDADYLHLFVWHEEDRELVGAYRLGLTDAAGPAAGRRRLYTSRLFAMKEPLFQEMGPAIELGRSFVRGKYQRSFTPLLLLWKGICAFVARHPRYKVLFGPVSISDDYASVSRQLMLDYLHATQFDHRLGQWVTPRRKPVRRHKLWRSSDLATLGDLDQLSALVASVEADRKGVPVLLRQYLKFGARILGFNIDPEFNHAIDVLIMVDLTRCERHLLDRYMGKEAAADYLARHSAIEQAA